MMPLSQWIAAISICCMLTDPVTSSKGHWSINLPEREFNIAKYTNITIKCKVTYPDPEAAKRNIQAFWKTKDKGKMSINNNDKNMFIFHPNDSFVIESFQRRTQLLGNISNHDCSLLIIRARSTDVGQYYFRVETGSDNYSFVQKNEIIHIVDVNSSVSGNEDIQVVDVNSGVSGNEDIQSVTEPAATSANSRVEAISISVPVVLILLVAAVIVIVLLLRRKKRRRNPVRQEMNYYENLQVPCGKPRDDGHDSTEKDEKEQEPPSTPEDTSIYANVQGGFLEEPTDFDPTENIYSNFGYDVQL
ncbi:uncharacterized protein LOC118803699 isoform X2 [Colossoma macropomum]|uniref:uncharacterized protein LOC118803699 isoform X2 n=1 Tax=Colossoma macropomum TaxID=42526 RepID=UPI00186425E1|nr:uncharacterized protein LOC118803699 isoform X2 [Colossoma macropomum]